MELLNKLNIYDFFYKFKMLRIFFVKFIKKNTYVFFSLFFPTFFFDFETKRTILMMTMSVQTNNLTTNLK